MARHQRDAHGKEGRVNGKETTKEESASDVKPEASVPALPEELPQPELPLIPHEVFQDKIRALRQRATIRNDKGEDVAFEGEAKEDFVTAFQKGYPILERTLRGLYELGTFLHGVRTKLRPHGLYHAWLDYAGIPRGTAQSYVQAYGRYREKLPRFAALGIRKLLIASRLPNCADYVEQHEQEIASQTTEELEKQIKELKHGRQDKECRAGRRPSYISVGSYRIRPSLDGNKITIEGMTREEQADFIAAIKELLLGKKDGGHDGRD
jgi:hypothetical protein